MDLARLFSLRKADVEIVKRTITEEFPEKNLKFNRNNNRDNRPPYKKTHNKTTGKISNGDCAEFSHPVQEEDAVVDNDDFVVIELVDEEDLAIEEENRDSFVDIDLQSSKQLLVYLSRKKRHLITCRTRAVSHTPLVKKFSTGLTVVYLQPFFRLTVSNTELWYITHRSSIYHRPPRRSIKRRPFHYTEKVECDDTISSHNTSKIQDASSGIQLTFSDERSGGVSKLTLSGDFTKSYEERHSKLHDVSRDIEAEEKTEPGLLRRSYSIEFLNEGKAKDDSTSAEFVAQQIEQGNARDIYADSVDEGSYSSTNLLDSTCETTSLKRSFSIEFLNEANDEDKPFSSEMVHYKIDKGEGVLVYTDIQVNDKIEQSSSHASKNDQPSTLKRSYSIEFLDESENNRSAFTYETVSNKIEKGEGRLVYDDSNINGDLSTHSPKKIKRKANKLKTLSIDMDVNDDGSMVPLSKQPRAYSIEMLNEMGDKAVPIFIEDGVESAPPDDVFDDEIVATEIVADETEREIDFFGDDFNFAEEQPKEGNLNVEKRSYSVEFLDEKPDLTLVLDNNMTSTPTKNTPSSPKKSPLQTVHVGLEFEKRNKSENDEDELFLNDGDEYLLYEDSSSQKNGRIGSNGGHRIPSFKLKTVVVDMETHHKIKRPSLQHDRKYQLEFQAERERRISMLRDARKARIPTSSASLRTVSIETGEEEIIHFEDELKPVEVLKKKAYSVEYLNEMEGDRSVFYEELVDDGELRWTMEC